MRDRPYSWIFAAVLVLVGLSIALTGSVAAQSADLVVATDDSGDHTSIQNAVDNASDTARIKIKSGVYKESITVDKNVTIVTPERATLVPSPSGSDYSGITITEHAEPHISGLNLHNFTHGIEAGGLSSTKPANTSWSATDISIDGNDEEFGSGIHTLDSSGEFNLRNITINNTYFGVYVLGTTDAWQAQNLTINSPGGNAVSGFQSTGAWTVEDTVIRNAEDEAIFAYDTEGNWTVKSTKIVNTTDEGINAGISSGDWEVVNTTIRNTREDGINAEKASGNAVIQNITVNDSDDGIDFEDTTGDWEINSVDLINISDDGIDAENTSGLWIIEDVVVDDAGSHGVKFDDSSGDSIIRDTKITDVESGIEGFYTTGDWLIQNVTVEDATAKGISVDHSVGSWTIESSTVRDISGDGIDAYQTDDGLISDVVIKNISDENGINLIGTGGDWVIEDSVIENVSEVGINGYNSNKTSAPTIRNVTVHDVEIGIDFYASKADWKVIDSTVSDASYNSIYAVKTEGKWSITQSVFPDGTGEDVNATDATRIGNASYNYWGATDGPSGEFCGAGGEATGNVTMYPYYTDSSLTTLSSATTSGTVQISSSCLIPEDISASDEQELVLTLSQISADGQSDEITITMPERVSVENLGDPRVPGTSYDVNVTNSGDPIKLEVNPDEPKATVDFVLRVPVELSSSEG